MAVVSRDRLDEDAKHVRHRSSMTLSNLARKSNGLIDSSYRSAGLESLSMGGNEFRLVS